MASLCVQSPAVYPHDSPGALRWAPVSSLLAASILAKIASHFSPSHPSSPEALVAARWLPLEALKCERVSLFEGGSKFPG